MSSYKITALLLLLSLGSFAAEQPECPPTARSFESLNFKRIAQKDLPKGVCFWASQGAESNEDPAFQGNVSYVDLNKDGIDEMIVESECKHENQYEFWQKRKGRWISLLTVWGRPILLQRRNEYYQIAVSWSCRDEETRELYAFRGDRYHINSNRQIQR